MEKCAMDLKNWSRTYTRFPSADLDEKMLQISSGIAKGLAHINKLGIIHNDLKPQNVFIDKYSKPFIGDFGVATNRGEERVGYTPQYFDKESLAVIPDEKSDGWLLGATLWEFWSDKPFDVDEEVHLDHIRNGTVTDILKKLLRPRDRRSIAERILKLFNSSTVRPLSDTLEAGSVRPPAKRLNLHASNLFPPKESPILLDRAKQFWDALEAENTAEVRSMLSQNLVEVDSSKNGVTSLQFACRKNFVDIVRLLLESGADHRTEDASGNLPIQLSTSVDVWKAFATAMPAPKYDLFDAAMRGDDVGVRLIIAAEKNPSTKLNQRKQMQLCELRLVTPLHVAAYQGHIAVCRVLLDVGADFHARDDRKWTPLSFSAFAGRLDVTRILIENGADFESRGQFNLTPLILAAMNGNLNVVKLLFESGADIEGRNQYEQTPLHTAAKAGSAEVARFLLEKGADIESRGQHDRTPLHVAAECGTVDVVRLLLDMGAAIESRDKSNDTPLIHAASQGHIAAVQLLLDKGADVEGGGLNESTPLLEALSFGHFDVARLLLDRGADIKGKDLTRPLLQAAISVQLELGKFLLEKGAHIESRDDHENTPLILAANKGHLSTVQLL
ncbi:hypothetical protein HDU96_003576, partial [Phlyctochytrium bullatum]